MTSRQRGHSLIELLIVLTIFTAFASFALPRFLQSSARNRVRLAAQQVAGALYSCRMEAVKHNANVAAKFRTRDDGTVTFTLYRDGDGDGVLTKDIERGVDPPVSRPKVLDKLGQGVGFGFPPGIVPRHPGTGRRLDRLHDPIRFNRSDLASFTPNGGATPGTVYLTDGSEELAAVRVYHYTGKIRSIIYDQETETWAP